MEREWPVEAAYRPWRFIVLHHSATEAGSVESINLQHSRRRDSSGGHWLGIGYHFLIGNGHGMPDGRIEPTFRWRQQLDGAHAGTKLHNEQGIGICLVGNFNSAPPTDRQAVALVHLTRLLQARFEITASRTLPHGDIKATACPGRLFDWSALLQRIGSREDLESATRSDTGVSHAAAHAE